MSNEVLYLATDEDAFEDLQDALEFIGNIASDENDAIGWSISVCKKIQPSHRRFIDARDLINDMQNKASDEFSEYSDDYLNDVEFDDVKMKSLNDILEKWFDENSEQPAFWQSGKEIKKIIVDKELLDKYEIEF